MELPPIVPSIQTILETACSHPEDLEIHDFRNQLELIEVERDSYALRRHHKTQLPLTQEFKRDPATGRRLGNVLVETSTFQETSKTSYSLNRIPGPRNEGVKGSSTNLPFLPAGLEMPDNNRVTALFATLDLNDAVSDEGESKLFEELFDTNRLNTIPIEPPFQMNLDPADTATKPSALTAFTESEEHFDFWQGQEKIDLKEERRLTIKEARKERSLTNLLRELNDNPTATSLDEEVELKAPVLSISKTSGLSKSTKLQWAESVDITKPMTDFEERVPDLAFKFDFTLDEFQKQSIALLEEHENVFVAAHTSAGKTVVAEYAIALSVRHMTRAIYTSPIKALSNQKFRDFKKNFESVGLVTGDVQINQSASCLIMTTEILRSMLYNGSDIIRDLEWVIFDEIHYLNNLERGHVWEEVLIMLPQHVSIIMLSATVPNALQFANWVGGIKRKKIYVISTSKRPVPLEHFLYTGTGGKSKSDQFLVLGADGKFLKSGYDAARQSLAERQSQFQKNMGPKSGAQRIGFNEKSEKNTYIGLIDHLKKTDKLPVVIFTFSRNRCDNYANMLESVDLCSGAQKGEIHGFFRNSISKLTGSDRELPQVLAFEKMLKNGIGVHHSGILPILKEVVEMLFQKGLVKLLFATETFAMGVNMPARTVVFDSCRKHDGFTFRNLLPAEYIQMAGRAGRRGKDTTGTVVILCKQGVPDCMELKDMMTGTAAKLESQFRLTYSMILNLLRVESITVEDVMKRSFLEAGKLTKIEDMKEARKKIDSKLEILSKKDRNQDLVDFYVRVMDFINFHEFVMNQIVVQTKVIEAMRPGRIVIVEMLPKYTARFGILINSSAAKDSTGQFVKRFKVLILTRSQDGIGKYTETFTQISRDLQTPINDYTNALFHRMMYFGHENMIDFEPEISPYGYPSFTIISEVPPGNILELVEGVSIPVDIAATERSIIEREMPRFRDSKLSANVADTINKLFDLHNNEIGKTKTLRYANLFAMTPMKNAELAETVQTYVEMKLFLKNENIFSGSESGRTAEDFVEVFHYMRLVEELKQIDFAMSPKSLQLHEEYQQRIEVLRKMQFIDSQCLVLLKGRVACEMGNQNELMMTELLLNNTVVDCTPEEIAALFSCMVFEAKRIPEPELKTPDVQRLREKVVEIKNVATQIATTQMECKLKEPISQYVEQFKFGLVEVVYEWAKGKPFSEIMRLTEVQEGLIVRTIQRLDEMIRDVKDSARIIGDPSLKKKMEEASQCIKRDIVFAASLYTQ